MAGQGLLWLFWATELFQVVGSARWLFHRSVAPPECGQTTPWKALEVVGFHEF